MKKIILATLILFCCFAVNGWATTFIGSISNISPDNTMVGNNNWASNTILNWTVSFSSSTNLWTYSYTFAEGGPPELSHSIIEVSLDFTSDNIKSGTTGGYEGPGTFTSPHPSNPGLPGPIWGIKWNQGQTTWQIVTDKEPMWGDFYAKGGVDTYAHNLKFGLTTNALIQNGNVGGWVLVPDTGTGIIPEPGTFLLLGTGLLGLAAIRYRRSKK